MLAEERRREAGLGGAGDGGELTQARLEAAEAAEAAAEAAAGPGLWPTGGLAEGAVRMRPACVVPGCPGEGGLRPATGAQSAEPSCSWDLDAPSGSPRPRRPSLQCNLCHASWHSAWWEHLLEDEQRQEQRQEYHYASADQMLPDLHEHLYG